MQITRLAWIVLLGLLLAVTIQAAVVFLPLRREDVPWTPLDLNAPIGASTGRKIAALGRDPRQCHEFLTEAGVGFTSLTPRRESATCGWTDAVRLTAPVRPRLAMSCPLAAGFDVWMRDVVQPAAIGLLGSPVVHVDDLGSYACRRIRGSDEGYWSEHASANAIDIAGVRLADGRRISVARDWRDPPRARFLRTIRDGGCRVFSTVLSPDYNAAHHDHLHLDQASRGAFGWRACR